MRPAQAIVTLALLLSASCAPPPGPADGPPATALADTLQVEPFGQVFRDARALAADPQGRLYVADAGSDLVHHLAPDGQPISSIGGSGSGDYAFLGPVGLDPTNGLVLYVADSGNGRVQRFSHEGRLLERIAVPADPEQVIGRRVEGVERGRPLGVAVAPAGEVYVLEAMRGVVLLYDDRRSLARVVGGPGEGRGALHRPVALALAPDDRLLVADAGQQAVLVYDAFGEFLRRIADGTARDVRSLAAGRDRIFVILADAILTFDLEGLLLGAMAVNLPEPLVGGALVGDRLVLLTRTRLWRATS